MKKGFTLIELLAVIVILAIILVIAVPRVMNVISNAKADSFESSVELLASGIKNEVMAGTITANGYCKTDGVNTVPAAVTAAVRYNPDDFGVCTFTVDTNTYEVTVTATGASTGKFGTQESITVTR